MSSHRGELWLENQARVSRPIKTIQQTTLLLTLIFAFLSCRIDFTTSNLNDENLNKLTPDKIPDVVSQASFIFILTLKCTTKSSLSWTVFELVYVRVSIDRRSTNWTVDSTNMKLVSHMSEHDSEIELKQWVSSKTSVKSSRKFFVHLNLIRLATNSGWPDSSMGKATF
jgi:hypothetical protein